MRGRSPRCSTASPEAVACERPSSETNAGSPASTSGRRTTRRCASAESSGHRWSSRICGRSSASTTPTGRWCATPRRSRRGVGCPTPTPSASRRLAATTLRSTQVTTRSSNSKTPGSKSSTSGRPHESRRRRLPERRQVLARQPPHAVARGDRARAAGPHARPQGAPHGVERAQTDADRHRRRRPRGPRRDAALDPGAGACGARGRAGRAVRRRRARRPAPRRPRDGRPAAAGQSPRDRRGQQGRPGRRRAARRRVPRARLRRTDRCLGRPGPRHRRPARSPRRGCARERGAGGGRGHRPARADRPPERRQVEHGQPHPRRRARDRLRGRRHHPRRDRPAVHIRGPQTDPRRHRRPAPSGQGRRLDRVLHLAAQPPRGRARRRCARRLRRGRRHHLAGPADRRARDAVRLRHRARPQQVGPDRRGGPARGRPRPRARLRRQQAAPAPARADRQRDDRPPRAALARRGDGARRPHLRPDPDPAAQPLPVGDPGDPPAAGQAEPPSEAHLHDADGGAAAALLDPGQLAPARHARLRLLHREPHARALSAGGNPADHRLRRAQGAPRRGTRQPAPPARPAPGCLAAAAATPVLLLDANDRGAISNLMTLNDNEFLFTSESVTEGHPDQISDGVLDAVLRDDPTGRVACETLVNTGLVVVSGEISTDTYVDIQEIARETIRRIGYTDADLGFSADSAAVLNAIDKQSPDIAQGVDKAFETRTDPSDDDALDVAGAGDQGMMFGYATNETSEFMPLPISLAHKLAKRLSDVRKADVVPYLRPDGKTQVSVRYRDGRPVEIEKLLISTQHKEGAESLIPDDLWEHVVEPILPHDLYDVRKLRKNFLVNPTGRFVIGGPVGDAGLTGRKIIVDTYGGMARHGGGAFSGKDPSKVDRSAAYAARYVAKNVVAAGLAERCEVQVAYAIGVAHPVSLMVETFGTGKLPDSRISRLVEAEFDMRPGAFRKYLDLHRPIFQKTAAYGHFGREDADFTWERTDRADALRDAAGLTATAA